MISLSRYLPVLCFAGGLTAGAFCSWWIASAQSNSIAAALAQQAENFGKASASNARLSEALRSQQERLQADAEKHKRQLEKLRKASEKRSQSSALALKNLEIDIKKLSTKGGECEKWLNGDLPACAIGLLRSGDQDGEHGLPIDD